MIEIASVYYENRLLLTPEKPQLLIIENPSEFYKTVMSFRSQILGEEGDFSFYEDGEKMSVSKWGEILVNPFDFDINEKRILNLLYKKAEKNFLQSGLITELSEIITKSEIFFNELSYTFSFDLEYETLSLLDVMKAGNVKIKTEYEGVLEKVISYVNVLIELKNIKFFIFVNIKSILRDDDLAELYRHCEMEKVALLLIESAKLRPLLSREKAVIITDDLCEIVAGMEEK